jgi:hypothetical protein
MLVTSRTTTTGDKSQVFFENRWGSLSVGVNEFYKEGCQEKTSPIAGGEMFSRCPAHGSFASLEKFDLPFW